MSACCECLRSSLFSETRELKRFRRNWINHFAVTGLGGICYFISIPSLHQFVTSSSSSTDIQPGLGLSETWYTWIVSVGSMGELVGAVCFGLLSKKVYIKWLILMSLVLSFAGGLLFGIGLYGWMLLVGRLLIGIFQGGQQTLWRVYIAETSVKSIKFLPEERRSQSTIKYTNFFVAFATATTSVALGPSLAGIVAQIPFIDQFRWPGWFICGAAVLLFLLTCFLYREKWEDTNRQGTTCELQDMKVPNYIMALIIIVFFFLNWQFAIVDTLLNPILADSFGLEIEYISYVFMGLFVLYLIGVSLVYILKQLRVNIRNVSLLTFSIGLTGCLVLTDWQSINGDPCSQLPTYNDTKILSSLILNDSSCSFHNISSFPSDPTLVSCDITCDNLLCDHLYSLSYSVSDDTAVMPCLWSDEYLLCYNQLHKQFFKILPDDTLVSYHDDIVEGAGGDEYPFNCPVSFSVNSQDQVVSFLHYTHQLSCDSECSANDSSQCVCEGSRQDHDCFWNPSSRITGSYCERCRATCLSKDHTLTFAQFIIGALLITLTYPMGRMSLTILASDGLGEASQGPVMGIMVATGSIGRFTGPIWGNAAYLYADHRTWLMMVVLSICEVVSIVMFIVLYRKLEKRKSAVVIATDEEVPDSVSDDISPYVNDGVSGVELLVFNEIGSNDDVLEGESKIINGSNDVEDEEACLSMDQFTDTDSRDKLLPD